MLYILLILIAEAVKPQAVRFGLDERGELCLQCNILRGGQQAFENGVLYASTHFLATLRRRFFPAAVSVLTS